MAELKMDFTKMTEGFVKAVKEQGMFVSWWIPVSERLPDKATDVLTTWVYEPTGKKYVEIAERYGDDDNYTFYSDSDEYKINRKEHKVIAWMPLPEPYEGDVIHDCENCKHYGEDLHGVNCRFCQDMNLWEVKDALTIIEAYKAESEGEE